MHFNQAYSPHWIWFSFLPNPSAFMYCFRFLVAIKHILEKWKPFYQSECIFYRLTGISRQQRCGISQRWIICCRWMIHAKLHILEGARPPPPSLLLCHSRFMTASRMLLYFMLILFLSKMAFIANPSGLWGLTYKPKGSSLFCLHTS